MTLSHVLVRPKGCIPDSDYHCCVPGTYHMQVALDKQAGILINDFVKTDVQSSQVIVLTWHWQSMLVLPLPHGLVQH